MSSDPRFTHARVMHAVHDERRRRRGLAAAEGLGVGSGNGEVIGVRQDGSAMQDIETQSDRTRSAPTDDGRARIAAETAYEWGVRVRRARLQVGATQAEVGARVGLSQSTVSRLELGRGAGFPLASWVAVADSLGIDLEAGSEPDEPFGVAGTIRLAGAGGWRCLRRRPTIRLGRPPRVRRVPRISGVNNPPQVTPMELAIVLVADLVTDVRVLFDRLEGSIRAARTDAPVGAVVSGVLLVRRVAHNRRRLSESRDVVEHMPWDSGSAWISALRSAGTPMPLRSGLAWLDPRATRLMPTGLRLRGV